MDEGEAELIGTFYDAVASPDAWMDALKRLQVRYNAEAAILGIYDPAARNISLSFTCGAWTKDVMESYARDYVKVDPVVPKVARQPAGAAIGTDRLLTADEKYGVFYNDFLRPLGISECLSGRLLEIPAGFSAIGIHRGPRQPSFNDADTAALERVIPHAARAFQLYRAFALLDIKATMLASMVDRLTAGLIATDRSGRPLHVNHTALRLIARKDGLRQDADGRLRADNRAADSRLLALHRDAYNGGAGGIVRVPRDNAHPYAVLIAPLPAGLGLAGALGEGRSGIMMLIHDPDLQTPMPAQILASMYGLTPRGAELAAALAAGDELKDYAERTGISMHTVRFHLKGLFAALGVRSQAQLVRLVVRGLAEFSLGRGRQRS